MLRLIGASSDAGLPRAIRLNHLQADETVTLGRGHPAPTAGLVQLISNENALVLSRTHAVVTRLLGRYYIADAKSINGTYVNSARLTTTPHALASGDIVSLCGGDVTLFNAGVNPYLYIFDEEAGPVAAAPPAQPPAVPAYVPREAQSPVEAAPAALLSKIVDLSLCAVCLDAMVAPHTTSGCSHSFCGECIARWASTKNSCPVCRGKMGKLAYNRILDEILDAAFVPTLTAVELVARDARERSWHQLNHSSKKRKRYGPPTDLVTQAMRTIEAALARGTSVPTRLVRYSRGAANGGARHVRHVRRTDRPGRRGGFRREPRYKRRPPRGLPSLASRQATRWHGVAAGRGCGVHVKKITSKTERILSPRSRPPPASWSSFRSSPPTPAAATGGRTRAS